MRTRRGLAPKVVGILPVLGVAVAVGVGVGTIVEEQLTTIADRL